MSVCKSTDEKNDRGKEKVRKGTHFIVSYFDGSANSYAIGTAVSFQVQRSKCLDEKL